MNQIEDLVRARYSGKDGWLTLDEVADCPGFGPGRRLDLVAVGCWGSNGMHTIGFEVKRTVADWRRELDQPGKREAFVDEVSEFVFVAPWKVIDPKEVPADCGLLSVNEAGELRMRVRAKQEKRTPSRGFLTALFKAALRRMSDNENAVRNFAEWKGRSLSFEDLRKLSDKGHNYLSERERQAHVANEERRRTLAQRSAAWGSLLSDLDILGHELTGEDRWNRTGNVPVYIARIRAAIQHVRGHNATRAASIATELRRIADQIAPQAAKGATA